LIQILCINARSVVVSADIGAKTRGVNRLRQAPDGTKAASGGPMAPFGSLKLRMWGVWRFTVR
jgi:hypothetical protein